MEGPTVPTSLPGTVACFLTSNEYGTLVLARDFTMKYRIVYTIAYM